MWYDARLPAHRAYADVIQEQLDAAKAVLIVWSDEAVRSHWVRSEADRARLNGTLIQARMEDCALPMPFDQIQCPSLAGWDGNPDALSLTPVLESIEELLNSNGASPIAPRNQIAGDSKFGRPKQRAPAAQMLFEAAMKALQDGRPSEHAQAVPLLLEATELAPDDSEAWGLLAVLYAARRSEVPLDERPALESRARSAIDTALKLNPDDARARCAEVVLVAPYRNWKRKEELARQVLSKYPEQPLALFSLAVALANVGRWRDASETAARISRTRFLLPEVERFTVLALWAAGDLVQAELAATRAARRWPMHRGVWEAQVMVFTHSGRSREALNMINDASRPADVGEAWLEAARSFISAVLEPAATAEALRLNLANVEQCALEPLTAAQRLAALACYDECFALLEGYYFERGTWANAGRDRGDVRSTAELFMPTMSSVWPHERFGTLTQEIGLNSYWEDSGVAPDFSSG